MRFILLKEYESGNILINPDKITFMQPVRENKNVILTVIGGVDFCVRVRETPEEIAKAIKTAAEL